MRIAADHVLPQLILSKHECTEREHVQPLNAINRVGLEHIINARSVGKQHSHQHSNNHSKKLEEVPASLLEEGEESGFAHNDISKLGHNNGTEKSCLSFCECLKLFVTSLKNGAVSEFVHKLYMHILTIKGKSKTYKNSSVGSNKIGRIILEVFASKEEVTSRETTLVHREEVRSKSRNSLDDTHMNEREEDKFDADKFVFLWVTRAAGHECELSLLVGK